METNKRVTLPAPHAIDAEAPTVRFPVLPLIDEAKIQEFRAAATLPPPSFQIG